MPSRPALTGFLFCTALALAAPVSAAFYKHVDAQGVVTYSNRPVASGQAPLPPTTGAPADPGRFVEVRSDLYGAMDIDLAQKQRNDGLPISTMSAADAQLTEANSVLRELLEQSLQAPPSSRPVPPPLLTRSEVYPLPWRGGPFRISQGANGAYSHNTRQGRYAIDIAMPEGTPVIAARAGQVLAARDGQLGRAGNSSGNYLRIRHEDGSMGVYLHLQNGSLQVKVGDWVALGAPLGRSGNTGNSTGPHLHFAVQRQVGGLMESVPFAFAEPLQRLPNFALGGE